MAKKESSGSLKVNNKREEVVRTVKKQLLSSRSGEKVGLPDGKSSIDEGVSIM